MGLGEQAGCQFTKSNATANSKTTATSELQQLKPLGFRAVYVVAKATTHKDSGANSKATSTAGGLKTAATKSNATATA
jgi:hypothetical protein